MSFFNLEVLKGQPTKSIWIMPQMKLSKTYVFRTKKLKIIIIIKLQLIGTYENMVQF